MQSVAVIAVLGAIALVVVLALIVVAAATVVWFVLGKDEFLDLITLPIFRIAQSFAEENKYFTSVPEGFAALVVVGGEYVKTLTEWEGRTSDSNGKIVPGRESKPLRGLLRLGGLRWLGFKGQVYAYRLRWRSIREDGSIAEHNEVLSLVMLKPHPYFFEVKDAEDLQNVRVNLEFAVLMRCSNPRKFVFEVQDPLETVFARLQPAVIEVVGQWKWQGIRVDRQGFDDALWARLVQGELRSDLEENVGVVIETMELRDISVAELDQEVASELYRAEQLGQAEIVRRERSGEARGRGIKAFIRGLKP